MDVTRPSKYTYFHGHPSDPWACTIHGGDATFIVGLQGYLGVFGPPSQSHPTPVRTVDVGKGTINIFRPCKGDFYHLDLDSSFVCLQRTQLDCRLQAAAHKDIIALSRPQRSESRLEVFCARKTMLRAPFLLTTPRPIKFVIAFKA